MLATVASISLGAWQFNPGTNSLIDSEANTRRSAPTRESAAIALPGPQRIMEIISHL